MSSEFYVLNTCFDYGLGDVTVFDNLEAVYQTADCDYHDPFYVSVCSMNSQSKEDLKWTEFKKKYMPDKPNRECKWCEQDRIYNERRLNLPYADFIALYPPIRLRQSL